MAKQCKEMTNFICRFGTFKFKVVRFELKIAPVTFQRLMESRRKDLSFLCEYLYEFLIYSDNIDDYQLHF